VIKCCSLQYISWTWVLRSVKLKPASLRNLSQISWISRTSDTEGDLITFLFAIPKPFANLLIQVYKGTSTGGGVIQANGLVGTWGVQTNVASLGCVHKRSSV